MAASQCVMTTSEHGWSANMVRIMEAQAMRENSMTSYMVSKQTREVNPKHSIMSELKRKASADKSDKTVKDLIQQVFPTILRSKMLGVLYVVMILNTSIFVATAHRSIFHAWMTGFLSWVVRLSHGVTYRIPVWSEQRFAG
jgi:exopolyphosphatase/pppGpp-phosphohydrolase